MSSMQPIRGVKWFRDIINDPDRQFGIKVHHHLPEKKVPFSPPGFDTDSIIRHPAQTDLLRSISSYFGSYPHEYTLPEAYAATIEQGTIVGNSGMVITPDGFLIAETAAMTGYMDGRCPTINDLKVNTDSLQWKGTIEGAVLSVANPNGGFGHHLMESFASMLWFDGIDIDYIHTAQGHNHARMSEFMSALGIPVNCVINSSRNECITAEMVSFFAPSSFFLIRSELLEMVERTLVAPRRTTLPPTRKLYLDTGTSTVGAHGRVYDNIDELRTMLTKRGYEMVDPATLDLNQKMELFGQASRIVSPAQSGLYNGYLFAPRNCDIVTILPADSLLHNSFQNRHVSGYSDCPAYPVYPEYCFASGYLLHQNGVGRYQKHQCDSIRTGKIADFYASKPAQFAGQFASSLNLDLFSEFMDLVEK